MPAVSEKQRRFMAMCASQGSRGTARKDCPLVSVAEEFVAADRKKKASQNSLISLERQTRRFDPSVVAKPGIRSLLQFNPTAGQLPGNLPAGMPRTQELPGVTLGNAAQMGALALADSAGDMFEVLQGIQERDPWRAGIGGASLAIPFVPLHTVFHGAGKLFPKFSNKFIGTGQGAQTFGHGLYFAEAPGTARSYATELGDRPKVLVGGQEQARISADDIISGAFRNDADRTVVARLSNRADALDVLGHGIDPKRITDEVAQELENGISAAINANDEAVFGSLMDQKMALQRMREHGIDFELQSHLYKVEIPDEAIPRMLDWDKPLSEQPKNVKRALESAGINVKGPKPRYKIQKQGNFDEYAIVDTERGEYLAIQFDSAEKAQKQIDALHVRLREAWEKDNTGMALYDRLSRQPHMLPKEFVKIGGNEQEAVSNYLRSLDIPGIRYLDQGSRTAGEGTRNIVLFDDSLAKIVEIDGQPVK